MLLSIFLKKLLKKAFLLKTLNRKFTRFTFNYILLINFLKKIRYKQQKNYVQFMNVALLW